jgi:hypothetical protein
MSLFQIITVGIPATADEWFHALHAPESELPKLTNEEQERTRRFGIDPEKYARGRMAQLLAEKREREQGLQFGDMVGSLLDTLGPDYRVKRLERRGLSPGWHLWIEKRHGKIWDLYYEPRDLDLILGSGSEQSGLESLKERLFREIGREDQLKAAS